MLRFLQIFTSALLFLSAQCLEISGVRNNPEKIGGVWEEDYAVELHFRPGYNGLAFDVDVEEKLSPQFDYHVSLELHHVHICSGAVLEKRKDIIIVPATCVDGLDKKDLTIRFATPKRENGWNKHIVKIVIHPNFRAESHTADIAILFTDVPLVETNLGLKLPSRGVSYVGQTGYITGWTIMYEHAQGALLLRSKVNVFDNSECPGSSSDMICVGQKARDANYCHYPVGSPLNINGYLVGISLLDRGCTRHFVPAVYTNVAQFSDWINAETSGRY